MNVVFIVNVEPYIRRYSFEFLFLKRKMSFGRCKVFASRNTVYCPAEAESPTWLHTVGQIIVDCGWRAASSTTDLQRWKEFPVKMVLFILSLSAVCAIIKVTRFRSAAVLARH